MGLKSFNPYTASRRFITVVDKSHITKQEPEKALVESKKRSDAVCWYEAELFIEVARGQRPPCFLQGDD
jgi:hypothetical protein